MNVVEIRKYFEIENDYTPEEYLLLEEEEQEAKEIYELNEQ